MEKIIRLLGLLVFVAHPPVLLALSMEDQKHLLGRLSFGQAAHPQLSLDKASRAEAVALLLDSVDATINVDPPGWLAFTVGPVNKNLPLSKEASRQFAINRNKIRRAHKQELKAWWLQQIHQGESPVAERLLLFWQNYFATQIQSLPTANMSWQQQLTLRKHAVGNFRALLRAMNQDPALLWYLDNQLNSNKNPNENYARELMELYTLGEGHFSEQDVKELARVMTGANVDRKTWQYQFDQHRHDVGEKSVFSSKGKIGPDEITDILLMQPRAKEYLVERLWVEFVSPTIDNKAIGELSDVFKSSHFEIRPLLQALFNHPSFWAEENRLSLYKSPVELLISTHLELNLPIEDYAGVVDELKGMGQELFEPPNVGGWPEGQAWIGSARLAERHQYILRLDSAFSEQSNLKLHLK